jgi:CHAT domain
MSNQNPDLQLLIRQNRISGRFELNFEVRAADPLLGLNFAEFGPVILRADPEAYARLWGKDVEQLFEYTREPKGAERRNLQAFLQSSRKEITAEHRLAGKGATMFKELLPEGLQILLWSLQGKVSTLQILSDEPYIPWEVMKLRRREAGIWQDGPFLCEAFAVSRWLRGIPEVLELPVNNLALVVPEQSQLPNAVQERNALLSLATPKRSVHEIEARFLAVIDSLAAGNFDAWHFSGHGADDGTDPNRWEICLDDQATLRPEDLNVAMGNFGRARPLIFFNACHTGRAGFSLAGVGGWSKQLLDLGIGAFIGTHWTIEDLNAKEFAVAFYRFFFGGMPIAESFRQARIYLHERFPGDPTWLAYTLFAHPLASCTTVRGNASLEEHNSSPLVLPAHEWQPGSSSPATLLRAECGVVPFHGRDRELNELISWCLAPARILIRLCVGPSGSGKTRLSLELAKQLRILGWQAGLLRSDAVRSWGQVRIAQSRLSSNTLIIIDDAESRRGGLQRLIRTLTNTEAGPFRLLLLAQTDFEWWQRLCADEQGMGKLFREAATTSKSYLASVTFSILDRKKAYQVAQNAFAERLGVSDRRNPPADLSMEFMERLLLLHMHALLALDVGDLGDAVEEGSILDLMLQQEWRYWESRAAESGLAPQLWPAIGRAFAAASLLGGIKSEGEAVDTLRKLRPLAGQPNWELTSFAAFLHACYEGDHWIEPLLPQLLGDHLAQHEIASGAEELLELSLARVTEV